MSDVDFHFELDQGPTLYEYGLVGAYPDARADNDLVEYLQTHNGTPNGSDVVMDNGLYNSGHGKLSLPYLAALQIYPDCLPGGAQERGDCVTWSTRAAVLTSYCNELLYGANEQKFAAPEVTTDARLHGVIATESWYWFRGHNQEGWTCSSAAKCALEKSGMWLRQDYPQFNFDLTTYSPRLAGKWGSSPPPEEIVRHGQQTLVKTATYIKTYEELRDLLANGNGVSTCGGESWSGSRNEGGVCNRTAKGWAHAIAAIAVDDRPETVSKYGGGLVLLQNSWGEGYLSGPRQIRGTDGIEIPLGSYWTRWNDMRNRQMIAFSAVSGWPARRMPNWGLRGII